MADKKLACSFCQRSQDDVDHLLAGPGIAICGECLGELSAILAEKHPQWGSAQIARLTKAAPE